MNEIVRELSAREIIENSDIPNKEIILKRLDNEQRELKDKIIQQDYIIRSYRVVLKNLMNEGNFIREE